MEFSLRIASFLAGLPVVAPSSFTYVSRSRAYDSTMGDVRKVYLKPREVISGSTSVAHTKGTPSRSAIWVATMVAALWLVPVIATQPRWITFSVCEPATSGLDSVSATMYFSLAPPMDLMPPRSLTRSQPSWKAFHVRWPQAALGP